MAKTVLFVNEEKSIYEELTKYLHADRYKILPVKKKEEFDQIIQMNPSLILAPPTSQSISWVKSFKGLSFGSQIIPVLGFRQETDPNEIIATMQAGFDTVISQDLLRNHPNWIFSLYARPDFPTEMAGKPLPHGIREGIDLFNERKFHESHDAIEAVWLHEKSDVRLLYQGLLQIGIAFYMLEKEKFSTSLKMFTLSFLKIRHFLPRFQGVEIADLYRQAKHCEEVLKKLGPKRFDQFDVTLCPTIRYGTPS